MRGKELILIKHNVDLSNLLKLTNQFFYKNFLIFIPFLIGIFSVFLGQDRNFDLASYHLYNAFSFVNNKEKLDFAVAASQSFINPIIDLPYYIFNLYLNPKFIGFIFGFFHGLIFILVYKISLTILGNSKRKEVFFISIFSIFTPNYLSGIGATMGDITTSIFNLTSILFFCRYFISPVDKITKPPFYLFFSGLFIGLSVGLKLTNAVFALGILMSMTFLLFYYFKSKKTTFIIFGLASFMGVIITGGYSFIELYKNFHNPFFPLLSNIFHNDFSSIATFDNRWVPKNIIDLFIFPITKSLGIARPLDSWAIQFFIPAIYTILCLNLFTSNRLRKAPLSPIEFFLVTFLCISYVIWIFLFSINRYLVTLEVLSPLVLFILIDKCLYFKLRVKNFFLLIGFGSSITSLIIGHGNWGHSGWTNPAFKIDLPKLETNNSLVLMTDDSPIGWMVTLFPKDLPFARLNGLDNSEKVILSKINNRNLHLYAFFSGYYNWRVDNVKKWDDILSRLNMKSSDKSCERLSNFVSYIGFRGKIIHQKREDEFCYLSVKDSDFNNPTYMNERIIESNKRKLASIGLNLNFNSCNVYSGNIGTQNWRYIWCKIDHVKN